MDATLKHRIEATCVKANDIYGKGKILAFVWSQSGVGGPMQHGLAIRQLPMGNMSTSNFRVYADFKTVRFMGKTRLVL